MICKRRIHFHSPLHRPELGNSKPPRITPRCPLCKAAMVKKTARWSQYAGKGFWGCTKFELGCKGLRPQDAKINSQDRVQKLKRFK